MLSSQTELFSKVKEKTLAMLDEKVLTHYVPLQGSIASGEERIDLEEAIVTSFDKDQEEVVLLIGDSGAGKSWFGQRFALRCWEQEQSERIVLWIPLLSIRDPIKHLLEDHLRDNLGLGNKKIEELKKSKQPLLVILDGYDELNTQENLFQTNNWANWGGGNRIQVMITCRKETLGGDVRGHEQRFWGSKRKLTAYETAAFDQAQREVAVAHYVEHTKVRWSAEEYLERLSSIPELDVFLQRPITLRLVLDALPAIIAEVEGGIVVNEGEKEKEKETAPSNDHPAKRIQLTRQKIYTIAMQEWFKQQADKLRLQGIKDKQVSIEETLEKFTRELALAFFQHRCNVLEWQPQEKEKPSAWSSLASASPSTTTVRTNPEWAAVFFDEKQNKDIGWLIKGCPLQLVGPHRYAFLHKSLLEFFAAEHLFNGALLSGWVMSGRNLSVGNLQDEPQVIAFLADAVKENEEFKQVLFEVIETSKYEPSAWVAAANAISVLNRARVNFSERNFRRVRLGGSDEQGKEWGADLSQAVLSGTDLREADLRFVNLSRAWLEYANLSGACMDGVMFGEWAYLQGEVFVYSADGRILAVVSGEKGKQKMTLYEGETQRVIKSWWMKGKESVTYLAFRPDGQQLASGSNDETIIRLWDVGSGCCERELAGHTDNVTSLSYRADGQQLASGSHDYTIRLWNMSSGRCEQALVENGDVISLSYRGDGQQLASGSWDGTIRLWDVSSGRCEREFAGHTDTVTSISYRGDGQQLASGSEDGTIRLWDVSTGCCERELAGHTDGVISISYRGDGQQLASGSYDKTIRLWDVSSGRCERELAGHTDWVKCVSYRGGGQQLASAVKDDKMIRLWDVSTGRCERELAGHTDTVTSISYRGDGQQLASGSEDNMIRLWDVSNGRCERELAGHTSCVSYRGDGQQLASGGSDGTIRLWDLSSGRCEREFDGDRGVLSISYRGDGQQLASGGRDGTIRLWDLSSGRCERELDKHTDSVYSISYRGDGRQLASGSDDCTIRLWDVSFGYCERELAGHTNSVSSISYRGDGQQLASGSWDETIRLWDVKSGKCKVTLKDHKSYVLSLAYHPTDPYLASSDDAGTLGLWDSNTYQRLGWWPRRHHGSLTSLAWSPSGDQLVTGGTDGAVRLWRMVQKDHRFALHLCWQSNATHLSSFNLNLTQVTGLSPANHVLLKQRGSVIGELSSRESAKFLEERNAQIYIPSGKLTQAWLDNPGQGSFVITPQSWLVALVRKRSHSKGSSQSGGGGQHVWIVIQGMTEDRYSVIKEVHFFLDSNKPTKYHNSIGTGLIQIRDKSPFDLAQQMKEGELVAKVWGISRDTVLQELLPAIERDQAREVGYLLTGRAPTFFTSEAYSCLSWCVKHLQDIGLPVESQSVWFNCIFAVPSNYLPAGEKEKEKEEPDTVGYCLTM